MNDLTTETHREEFFWSKIMLKKMLHLELVLRTPMKMEKEELRRQKMVGNI